MKNNLRLLAVPLLAATMGASAPVALPPDHAARMTKGTEMFRQDVAPLLQQHCVKCHGGEKTKGDFDLTTREGLLKGGAEGEAVVPFDSGKGWMMKLVRHEDDPAMPDQKPKLPDDVIAKLAAWIDHGAPYAGPLVEGKQPPKDRSVVTQEDRKWWAFQPIADYGLRIAEWKRAGGNPIDGFLAEAGKSKHLALNPPADARTLARRAFFDLTGLPPTPEDVEAFSQSAIRHPKSAIEALVDQLLDAPAFGERWARHWLDVARFAESSGFEHDYDRPFAFHYRDFVIKALNGDMPYDQFVRWQLAGDEFAPGDRLALMATGFIGAGVFPTQITANEVERTRYDALDDMLSTTGSAFLGLTVGCARCHDHKFDPIPTADYYRMLSTFTTTVRSNIDLPLDPAKTRAEHEQWSAARAPLVDELRRYEDALAPRFEAWLADPQRVEPPAPKTAKKKATTSKEAAALLETLKKESAPVFDLSQRATLLDWWKHRDPGWLERDAKLARHTAAEPKGEKVLVCAEGYPPLVMHSQGAPFLKETHILKRGDVNQKSEVAAQSFLQVLTRGDAQQWQWQPPSGAPYTGRRRSLANWLTDVDHGAGALLARVAVNRLWQHHFGRGLVATPNDFGKTGALPSHPELLDWLASELIRNGWHLKPIHRLIMTSAAYRQSSACDAAKLAADPDNTLFLRRTPQRLEAEAVRDSILAVSGRLDRTMFGAGTRDENSRRRSIYFTIKRSQLLNSMVVFDAPEPLVSQGARPTTTVAPQALLLMNSPQIRAWAEALAQRAIESAKFGGGESADAVISRVYQLALARWPRVHELETARAFVANGVTAYTAAGKANAQTLALADLGQTITATNEFIYVE